MNEGGASTWFVADSFGLLLLHAYYGFNQPTVSVISWRHVGQPTASQKDFDLIFSLILAFATLTTYLPPLLFSGGKASKTTTEKL